LNGFIYSSWGLLDLIRYNDNALAKELWEEGLKTMASWLPQYDMGYWSLYHIGDGIKNPATIPYHKLHIEQMKVMYDITGQKIFKEYADRWTSYLNSPFGALRTLPQKILWNLARGF
ncbi:MAG: D-glucuronyl C5-epimerase family protein, partial [Candidatus Zixiibacteriota bacterium]